MALTMASATHTSLLPGLYDRLGLSEFQTRRLMKFVLVARWSSILAKIICTHLVGREATYGMGPHS